MLVASIASFLALSSHQVSAGQALLDESAAKLKSAQSITFTLNTSGMGQTMKMPIKIMRGGYLRFEMSGMGEQIVTPAGGWMLMSTQKQYMKQPSTMGAAMGGAFPGLEALFSEAKPLVADGVPTVSKIGTRVTTRIAVKNVPMMRGKGYIHLDPQSKLPAGFEGSSGGAQGAKSTTYVVGYDDLKVDAGLTAKDFDWTPPAGWTEFKSSAQDVPAQTDFTANLLKLGSKAPSFSLRTPKGGNMSLARAMEGRKATLVNFWFYG